MEQPGDRERRRELLCLSGAVNLFGLAAIALALAMNPPNLLLLSIGGIVAGVGAISIAGLFDLPGTTTRQRLSSAVPTGVSVVFFFIGPVLPQLLLVMLTFLFAAVGVSLCVLYKIIKQDHGDNEVH